MIYIYIYVYIYIRVIQKLLSLTQKEDLSVNIFIMETYFPFL